MFPTERQGAVTVVSCDEPISAEHLEEFTVAVHGCLSGGQPLVILDLNEVAFIDGRGLESLLELQGECERYGGAIKLASPAPVVNDALRVTGVVDRFEMFSSVKEAIGSFSR